MTDPKQRTDKCSVCGVYFVVLHPEWADTHECDECTAKSTKELEEFWYGFYPTTESGL